MQKPSFEFSFLVNGKIWQTALDIREGKMVLEIRNAETRSLHFRVIDLRACRETPDFAIPAADWWTTPVSLHYPLLFLEQYANPQDPTDKSLLIYHLTKQELVKREEHFQLVSVEAEKVTGHHPRNRDEKREFTLAGHFRQEPGERANRLEHPLFYVPGSSGMNSVREYLQLEPGGPGCEYLEFKTYIIISYYLRSSTEAKFVRKLLVLKGDDELYHDIQDDRLDGFARGAFFMWNELLIFIKNGNQINGIEL